MVPIIVLKLWILQAKMSTPFFLMPTQWTFTVTALFTGILKFFLTTFLKCLITLKQHKQRQVFRSSKNHIRQTFRYDWKYSVSLRIYVIEHFLILFFIEFLLFW